MAYSTAGIPGNKRQVGLPRGMGSFPAVGNGLGGLPVRRPGGLPALPNYRQDIGCYVRRNVGGNEEYWYYRKTADFQLTTASQILESYTPVSGTQIRGCESADGLHLWFFRYDGGTSQMRIAKYSRPDVASSWTLNAATTRNFASPGNVLVSANGGYCLVACTGDVSDTPTPSAILWQYTAGAITQRKIWTQSSTSSIYPVAALNDLRTGRFYCLVGGFSTSQNAADVTRPELGYIKDGVWTSIAFNNTLTAVVGFLGTNCRFGFLNTKLGFLHIDASGSAVREFLFDDTGVTLTGTLINFVGVSDNTVFDYPAIQVSPRDDYFSWASSYTGGTFRVLFGYKDASGIWTAFDSASMAVTGAGQAAVSVSPDETRIIDYDSSATRIRPFSYSPTTGITVGSSIATLANAQWPRFSTDISSAVKRTP